MHEPTSRIQLWWWAAGILWRHGRPGVVLGFRGGLGDDLLCTAPIHELLTRGTRRIWFISRHPELYHFDRRVSVIPAGNAITLLSSRIGRPVQSLSYSSFDAACDRDTPLTRPVIAEMCHRAGLTGDIMLRPHLRLERGEIDDFAAYRGALVVQSSGLSAAVPMLNKQWPANRIQSVVDRVGKSIRIVQTGSAGDPPLVGAEDLRGKTTLRQTAALLHVARLYFGTAGFLMHLARAVDCPAVIVYGGRESHEFTGYRCNINLSRNPPCSPCWQRNRCDHARMCLDAVLEDDAAEAIEKALALPRAPLATDLYHL